MRHPPTRDWIPTRSVLTSLLLPLAVATACKKSEAPPAAPDAAPAPVVKADDSATCQGCHQQVYDEWTQSMHAQAHHSMDPLYAAIRTVRMKREGEGMAKMCASCHHPRAVDDPEGAVAKQGVSCASCHQTQAVKAGLRGHEALVAAADGTFLGPHGVPAADNPAHGGGPAPAHMKDGASLCLACHGELVGPKGVPVCTTGPEWHGNAEGKKTCVDCHMPEIDGPSGAVSATRKTHRSHRFVGPRGTWSDEGWAFMASGVAISGRWAGKTLTVALNNDTQHAFPSGFPARMAMVKVEAFDAAGASVWAGPPVILNKVYVDEAGQPTLAPYAHALKSDTRLSAGEVRQIGFEVPKEATSAKVTLAFRLLPPPLAKKIGLEGSPLAGVRPIRTIEVRRDPAQ